MDLNQLLYNHQLALMNEQSSSSLDERETYFDLVQYYAKRIREFRERAGLPRYKWINTIPA